MTSIYDSRIYAYVAVSPWPIILAIVLCAVVSALYLAGVVFMVMMIAEEVRRGGRPRGAASWAGFVGVCLSSLIWPSVLLWFGMRRTLGGEA